MTTNRDDGRSGARRSGGAQAARLATHIEASPFLTRTLQPFEVVSEEGLAIIEHNADTILEEVGVIVRDYPAALDAVRRRRRRRRRRTGALPARHVPLDRAGDRAGGRTRSTPATRRTTCRSAATRPCSHRTTARRSCTISTPAGATPRSPTSRTS